MVIMGVYQKHSEIEYIRYYFRSFRTDLENFDCLIDQTGISLCDQLYDIYHYFPGILHSNSGIRRGLSLL